MKPASKKREELEEKMNDKIRLYAARLAKLADLHAPALIVVQTFMLIDRAMRVAYEDAYFKAKREDDLQALRVRFGLCIDCGEPDVHRGYEKDCACADCRADRESAEAELEEELLAAEEESLDADDEEES